MTMDDFHGTKLLGQRQDASPSGPGSGGSNTFLELIANPFVAAVCSSTLPEL